MVITLGPDLEAALKELARKQGIAPEALALQALCERFLGSVARNQAQDDWERRLRSAATNCGISLSNEAVSSEALYD
jgi:predicted transcriptional regulator